MNTDPRRKASANYHAKRREAGWKTVTIWLPPEGLALLAELKAKLGSNDAAVLAGLKALASPTQPPQAIGVMAGAARPQRPKDEPPPEIEGPWVELGRPAAKPGSLLKKR